jgi:hypothetical protein
VAFRSWSWTASSRRREKDLVIVGPPAIEPRVLNAMEVLFPGSAAVTRRFDVAFAELAPGETQQVVGASVSGHEGATQSRR